MFFHSSREKTSEKNQSFLSQQMKHFKCITSIYSKREKKKVVWVMIMAPGMIVSAFQSRSLFFQ
jgi:hypothetical protein